MNVIGHLRRLTALALTGACWRALPMAAQDQAQRSRIRKPPIPSRSIAIWCSPTLSSATKRPAKSSVASPPTISTIQENGKPQKIISFDFESVDQAAPLNEATVNGKSGNTIMGNMNRTATSDQLRNHRLIVMFFDITSMQPEDLERAQDAARNYINKQMQPADLVAVVSLDQSLSLDQDFTANKQLLLNAVNAYSGTQGSGFQSGATSTTNQVEDATSFTADESGIQRHQHRPRALCHRRHRPLARLHQREKVSALFLRRHPARRH